MAEYKKYLFDMPTTTYKPSTYSDKSGAYAGDIAKAQDEYNKAQAAKPAAYQSQYSDQMSSIMSQLGDRKFSYDVNSDALFQQLKALYNEQGKLAMQDTQGQAAALTGGYGNSYAVSAGQQAYQQAQNQLYDRVPELYQLALSRYQQEGADLKDQYSLLASQDATDYGRYRDTVTDYENERAYREAALRNLQSMNQNLWSQNEANAYNANQQAWNNYWTAEQQNQHNYEQAVAEDQWNANFAENQRQFDETMEYNRSKDNSSSMISALQSQIEDLQSDYYPDGSRRLTRDSKATASFTQNLISKAEFQSRLRANGGSATIHGKKVTDWKSYVNAVLENEYNNDKFSDAEVAWLKTRYKLGD